MQPIQKQEALLYFSVLPKDLFDLISLYNKSDRPEDKLVPGIDLFGPRVIMESYREFTLMKKLFNMKLTAVFACKHLYLRHENILSEPTKDKTEFDKKLDEVKKFKSRFESFYPENIQQLFTNRENTFKLIQTALGGPERYKQYKIINIGYRKVVGSGYIDFIKREEVTDGIMTGTDPIGRRFVVIKASRYYGHGHEDNELAIQVFFERYPCKGLWSTAKRNIVGDDVVDEEGKLSSLDVIRRLHQLATTGRVRPLVANDKGHLVEDDSDSPDWVLFSPQPSSNPLTVQ